MSEALHAFAASAPPPDLFKHGYALLEYIPIGISICDRDGTVTYANKRAAALLGLASVDVPAAPYDALRPFDDKGRLLTAADLPTARVLRSGVAERNREIVVERRDGQRLVLLTTTEPMFDDDGELAGAMHCVEDITARKHAAVHDAQGAHTLRDLLESLPAAVYTTDAEGTITFFNQASAAIAGRTPRVGEDKWCVSWKLFKPDGTPVPHEQCPMAVALRDNRAVRGEELVVERPDGVRIPIIPYPTPIRDDSGWLVGAINMLVDISERRQAEYRQRMLLDELNHRVKNNLQMLHALLRTAHRETEDKAARAVLEDAAHRVGAIAASQRALYGSESATSFNTREFVHAVCQAAQQTFAGDVKIKIDADAGEMSNETSMPLALILNELLTNAVKHGFRGRRHGTVRVELARQDTGYVLAVEDGGDGFELTPSARRSSGLGLIRGLARQLGGHFAVERGAGARCIVRFPVQGASLH